MGAEEELLEAGVEDELLEAEEELEDAAGEEEEAEELEDASGEAEEEAAGEEEEGCPQETSNAEAIRNRICFFIKVSPLSFAHEINISKRKSKEFPPKRLQKGHRFFISVAWKINDPSRGRRVRKRLRRRQSAANCLY